MTIDLQTGEEYAPRREDYCTKITGTRFAQPGTPHPLWSKFLDRVTGGDLELQRYLQRVAGYCLTGITREHVMFFLYGTGANGKSVFVGTLIKIWGDYALTINTEMLMASTFDRHPTEIARLRGVRLAVGSEVEVGRAWAESRIKALTGGDRLQGRFMRRDFFEFTPQFKLMIVGNHKPNLNSVDEAIRRRIHLIPFTVTIPAEERDLELAEKLKAEWPAILRWAVDGCTEWQRSGLAPPPAVTGATAEYFAEADPLGRWLEERCVRDESAFALSKDLFADYQGWCGENGEKPLTSNWFGRELNGRGIAKGKNNMDERGYRLALRGAPGGEFGV
jgi:putative DNA primase/helicase